MTADNPFAEFERHQSDRAWKITAGRWSTEQHLEEGGMISWMFAEWVIYSDEEPDFEDYLVAVPGGDGEVDAIRIEDLDEKYVIEMLSMDGGDLHGLDEDDELRSIVDWTYVWNFRVEEMS